MIPAPGAMTISLADTCMGTYTMALYGVDERVSSITISTPSETMFLFPLFTLFVHPSNALPQISMSCFQIMSDDGTEMLPAFELTELPSDKIPHFMNYHITDVSVTGVFSPEDFSYSITREVSVLPGADTMVGAAYMLAGRLDCFCPNGSHSIEVPVLEAGTETLVDCVVQIQNEEMILFYCVDSMSAGIWHKMIFKCSGGFTEAILDACFNDGNTDEVRIGLPVDSLTVGVDHFDTVQFMPAKGILIGSVITSRALANNIIDPLSVMGKPTTVTITVYLHVLALQTSIFTLSVYFNSSMFSLMSQTIVEAGPGLIARSTILARLVVLLHLAHFLMRTV